MHLDMFDGVEIDSPNALTFGPQMVRPSPPLCRSGERVARAHWARLLRTPGAHRDETRPVSTGRGTRRVQLVREGGGGPPCLSSSSPSSSSSWLLPACPDRRAHMCHPRSSPRHPLPPPKARGSAPGPRGAHNPRVPCRCSRRWSRRRRCSSAPSFRSPPRSLTRHAAPALLTLVGFSWTGGTEGERGTGAATETETEIEIEIEIETETEIERDGES